MIGIILGIFGIIITVGFGIYSVIIYKKSKKNVSIEFENKECYSLFRDDVNRLNIELSYNKNPISNTLILLKARLKNNGQVDIDKNRIYNPLKIISSTDFKWLETTITSKPNGVSASIKILNPSSIQIDWDLLKKNEFIEIEALAETIVDNKSDGEKSVEFYNNLKFDYRITDLSTIQKETEVSSNVRRKHLIIKMSKVMATLTIVLGGAFLFFDYFPQYSFLPEPQVVNYVLSNKNEESIGNLQSNAPNEIKIKRIESEKIEKLSVKEFNDKYKIKEVKSTIRNTDRLKFSRMLSWVYVGMGLLLFSLQLLLKMKMKRKKAANNV